MIISLTGADTFRSQRRFEQLRQAFKQKHDPTGISTVVVDMQTSQPEDVRAAVATQGFFSTKRFVGMNHFDASALTVPAEVEKLVQPFAELADLVIVIREVPSKPASVNSARKRLIRTTKRPSGLLKLPGAKVEVFDALAPAELKHWIGTEAKQRGGKIATSAVDRLVAWCGNDLWRLSNELDKLIARAAGQDITPELVAEQVRAPEVSDVFALMDAVANRQRQAGVRLLTQELQAGTHPLALVTLLANHINVLLNIQKTPGQPAGLIAKDFGIHPFVASKAVQQSRQFPPEQLTRWHDQLLVIDETIKTSSVSPEALMDLLLIQG